MWCSQEERMLKRRFWPISTRCLEMQVFFRQAFLKSKCLTSRCDTIHLLFLTFIQVIFLKLLRGAISFSVWKHKSERIPLKRAHILWMTAMCRIQSVVSLLKDILPMTCQSDSRGYEKSFIKYPY